jgi:hypothetical protein
LESQHHHIPAKIKKDMHQIFVLSQEEP